MKVLNPIRSLMAVGVCLALFGCGGGDAPKLLTCDDSLMSEFKPDAQTEVLLVKQFRKGDAPLSPPNNQPDYKFSSDVCLVKMIVGPGNPGPAGAPSTSKGIGIEVWLPTSQPWNGRVHATGSGGWAGSSESVVTKNSEGGITGSGERRAMQLAAEEGSVTSSSDHGFVSALAFVDGSPLMNPDGTINQTLWRDFSSRALYEQAVKTKALAKAFFGIAAKFSYFDGGSTGGRQALKLAQDYPELYDGIVAGMPALSWSKLMPSIGWPAFVMQRDLGGTALTAGQVKLVSTAAIAACDLEGGYHLGYILDPGSCRYDPSSDPGVLCTASGGVNATADCVTGPQATTFNKFWYGITSDGSVPSPAADIGWEVASPAGLHRWYGFERGADVTNLTTPFLAVFAMPQIALSLQNPKLGPALLFKNASGNGEDGWKNLSYAQYSAALDKGAELQPAFANIDTDKADLTAFRARGGKLIMWHGLADSSIPPQSSINYYNRVATQMGGIEALQSFYRFYLIPGMAHGFRNGSANADANPPLPAEGQFFDLLSQWVESGTRPGDRVETTAPGPGGSSAPLCAYPRKRTYAGGDPKATASYNCS